MLSGERYFCFRYGTDTTDYNSEVKMIFKHTFNTNNQMVPSVDAWDNLLKMTSVFGRTHVQTNKKRRMVLSIEAKSALVSKNDWTSAVLDICEEAETQPCEECLKENEMRLGCTRLFPRIREVFAMLCSRREDMEEDGLLPEYGIPCPL
jgi:hypothetical protein